MKSSVPWSAIEAPLCTLDESYHPRIPGWLPANSLGGLITPLLLTEVTLPDAHPRAGEACPVFGFLIDHPGGRVLVDTGVGTGNEEIDAVFAPVHHGIEDALSRVGAAPNDMQIVINTHLHFDHCGQNRLFPGVPIVAQQAEYNLAKQPDYTVGEWVDFPGVEWRLVDGETELLPGLTVVPTPGHTPGHQSVMIKSGDDTTVIAGQAVYDCDELDAEASTEPLSDAEAEATSVSARRIKNLQPDRVYFSHDGRVWIP